MLAGEQAWCCVQALKYLASGQALWLGQSPHAPPRAQAASATQKYLGRELDAVIFDAHAGFDPDAFGAITGSIRAGGQLLLLTPPLDGWPQYPDPINTRLTVHPVEPSQLSGHYLARLASFIRRSPDVILHEQNSPPPRLPAINIESGIAADIASPDQAAAVEAIERVATGHRNRPIVLTADRGRGKSAALGIAAARLLRQGKMTILLTAPRRAAVDTVFQHARQSLPQAQVGSSQLSFGAAMLRFIAPDELALQNPAADLVLVDEAAGIHLQLLERFLSRYRRLVFSSTVHGYEGAGRGFALRFKELLQRYAPDWRALELRQPIRWDEDDPLERFTFQALLLDAEPPAISVPTSEFAIEQLDRAELAGNEAQLRVVFGLLVQAHYQTRPLDLRQLLDGPNLRVYALKAQDQILAVALLADEGRFDTQLSQAIANGQRRPQGHQLPQILAYQHHCSNAARLRYARIVRIAVHPNWQGRGYGSQLLSSLIQQAQQEGFDALGAVFGASPKLIHFWRRQEFWPAQIGLICKAASGSHSVTMLRALSTAGAALQQQLEKTLQRRLPYLLAEPLRELDTDIVALVLQSATPPPLKPDHVLLQAFAEGRQNYELVLDALNELALAALSRPAKAEQLSSEQRRVFIAKLLQKRDWQDCARLLSLAGRRQVENCLRDAVRCCLK